MIMSLYKETNKLSDTTAQEKEVKMLGLCCNQGGPQNRLEGYEVKT